MILSIIVAIAKNNEIGQKNALLWNLPADMKHFKETTTGHTVVMGQRTFESIGHPLSNRRNIILTLDEDYKADGVEIFHTIDELEDNLKKTLLENEEAFVIGGGQIYKLFIDKADKLYITHVEAEFPEADTFFPLIEESKWQIISEDKYPSDKKNEYPYSFVEYIKK